MPHAAPRPCSRCGVAGCTTHKRKAYDIERGSSTQRLYGYRWQQASARFKRDHPFCKPCQNEGRITRTFAVDHIIPHRGNPQLFWDQSNWQPICESHHNSKARTERLT